MSNQQPSTKPGQLDAARLAEQMNEQLRIWDRDNRHGPAPRIIVYSVYAPDEPLPSDRIIDKRHTRVAISWRARL